jgi:KaiC/GvpD/RAD55 family RecA-like ATPase
LLSLLGQSFALGVLIMGLAGFLQFYARTRYRPHLAMLPTVVLVVGSTFILFSIYPSGDTSQITLFLLIQSAALPFFVYWGEQSRRSMEEIATTGEFDPGFPLPSENVITVNFFGQIYEDLAKPVVALEGEEKLNRLLAEVSEEHPIFNLAGFTPRGEFVLDERTVLWAGRIGLDTEGFARLLDALVEHFARIGNIKNEELPEAIRAKTGNTVAKYLDFLVDGGLVLALAKGLLTDKTATGLGELDKALKGGLTRGCAVLLVGEAGEERDELVRSFLQTGIALGEGCLVVSALKSPEAVRSSFEDVATGQLKVVDCHTAHLDEVQELKVQGDTIISPVDLSVVAVAVTRALDSLNGIKVAGRRAVIDLLPAYLQLSSVSKMLPDLVQMIGRLRRGGCTALFVHNPSIVEDQLSQYILEELFDSIIRTRRETSDGREKSFVDLQKLGPQTGSGPTTQRTVPLQPSA